MVSIHKIIAAISPDIYCDPKVRKEVKSIVSSQGYLKAAEKAIPIESEYSFNYDEAKKDAMALWGLTSPKEEHALNYDSAAEGLEPIYFWLLDFIKGPYREVDKIIDNFMSSPGSGHFSELQGRAIQMQQEVSRNMATINTILKSVLNLLYDLKEFKLRLEPYKMYKSSDQRIRATGLLALKQIWLDNVDIRKQRGSINALSSGELEFTVLGDAFRAVKSLNAVDNLDLNDRVKRLLKDRVREFFSWIPESENSLTQRYNIEKNYLKSQVSSLKLTSKWVKPYLKAAQKLEQSYSSSQAALVTTFNTILLELKLLAKSQYNPEEDIKAELLPDLFNKVKTRKYFSILILELDFRGIPQRVSQRGDWSFGGRTEMKFTSYGLNEEELKALKETIDKDDMGDIMNLIEGSTDDSLDQIQKDIDEILEDKSSVKPINEESQDINPFTALFSFIKRDKKVSSSNEKDISKGIKPDSKYERVLRSQAIIDARDKCFTVFDKYKKAHGMPSHANPFDAI